MRYVLVSFQYFSFIIMERLVISVQQFNCSTDDYTHNMYVDIPIMHINSYSQLSISVKIYLEGNNN